MARMPGAVWQGEHSPRHSMVRYDVVCVHTIVGYAPAHAAHFSVKADGTILQSRDTAYQSGANLYGNPRVIAIENEDHGPRFPKWTGSDVPALTPEQVEANARILAWAHEEHGIPLRLCPDSRPTSRGLAYHRQGIDGAFDSFEYPGRVSGGEVWSTSRGKVCPGDRRIAQLPDILARARQIAGPGVDLAGFNGAWHLPRAKRRELVRAAAPLGEIVAGVECKWLDVARIVGDQFDVIQDRSTEARAGVALILPAGTVTENVTWSVGTTPVMAGRPKAAMLTRHILEADVQTEVGWVTVLVTHFPLKRYFWLYARHLRNLRKRMASARHPVAVFADWNKAAAAVAAGTGLFTRGREVMWWAFPSGADTSKARPIDVGGDHPAVVVTLRSLRRQP